METDHHHHGRFAAGRQRGFRLAHEGDHLVINGLDRLLARSHAPQDIGAQTGLPDLGDELVRDFQIHVGIDQRIPDLRHRVGYVRLGQYRLAPQFFQRILQFSRKIIKHFRFLHVKI